MKDYLIQAKYPDFKWRTVGQHSSQGDAAQALAEWKAAYERDRGDLSDTECWLAFRAVEATA